MYKIYKRKYLDLDPKLKTNAMKKQVTQKLSRLTSVASYLSNDLFVPFEKCFLKPSNVTLNVKDVLLFKFAADM